MLFPKRSLVKEEKELEDEIQFEIRVSEPEAERAENMIHEVIAGQERELGLESDLKVAKRREVPTPPAEKPYVAYMTWVIVFTVIVAAPFAAGFFKKAGENLADYITRRLKEK